MINLLKKEIFLSMHQTAPLFLLLSAMLLIPNYPYYVVFFYTGLAIFFTCLTGRENNDVFYTTSLPIPKTHVVKARFLFVISLQLKQVIIAIPFAVIRQQYIIGGNLAGMDANIALFGISFVMLGVFNLVFLPLYYKDLKKVGGAFVKASIAVFVFILLAEAAVQVVPFFRDVLDTPDNLFLTEKLTVLAIGIVIYIAASLTAYKISVKRFLASDL